MDLIHLLPDSVANQIAAGEVIQRPASVVKELVENAVDAVATTISVIITDAGRTCIQVVDDGCGMSETDARLAFERHATSKIAKASDLFTLTTLGFRGEALPSIASVAQVQLTTRRHDAELGTVLRIEGSRVVSQQPEACPPGSNFVVQNLFYNIPARRKFLKTDHTELANIVTEVERIVLIHPETSFTLTHNGNTLMRLPAQPLRQRVASVFGTRLADQLLPVDVDTPLVKIHGFVGQPESARRRGVQQFFFAGGRYMRHPYFHRAVQEAFAALIPAETSVPYFIAFDVDPAEIDVNIHPTKTEIKFENEQAVWQILLAALRETLGRHNAIPTIDFDTEGRPADIPVFNPARQRAGAMPLPPTVEVDTTYNPFDTAATQDYTSPSSSPSSTPCIASPPSAMPAPLSIGNCPLSAFQLLGRYIATPSPDGLMLIDQHRAHTRVLYDRYMTMMRDAAVPSQRLLFPEVVELNPSDVPLMPDIIPHLLRLGLDVCMIGPNTASVAGMPAGLEGIDPVRLMTDLLAAARQTDITHASEQLVATLALALARDAAIPVGQVLSPLEMDDLMSQLFATEAPAHTPDGKRVIATIAAADMERLF